MMIAEGMSQQTRLQLIHMFLNLCQKATESQAVFFLQLYNYDVQKAVIAYLENPSGLTLRNLRKAKMMDKYSKYLEKRGGIPDKKQSIFECMNRTVRKVTQELRLLWKELVPYSARGVFPGELFYQQYGVSLHWVHLQDANLEDSFKTSYQTGKPLVVYEYNKDFLQNAMTVFTIETAQLLNWQFLTVGIGSYDTEARAFLRKECGLPEQSNTSTISVFRVDQCQDVTLVSHLMITEAVTAVQAFNFFQQTLAFITEQKSLESQAVREVQNGFKGVRLSQQIHSMHSMQSPSSNISDINNDSGLMEPEYEQPVDWLSEKELRLVQEEEFKKSEFEHERRKKNELEAKLLLEKEEKELEEKTKERRTRKMSLPQEPEENGGVITLGFRLPRGGRILRRFSKESIVQEIFDYIELNQQVEFENQRDRQFDLLMILGGQSLAERKQSPIKNVFGEQTQQTLLVKEL